MFELLTRILLWLLIGTILWYVFSKFIPRVYLTWLGGIILFAFVILAFIDPTNSTVGTVWSVLSLPLKPLGLVFFLLLSSLKKGAKSVDGNLVLAAVLVLLLTSTPIVAYWLTSQAARTLAYSPTVQRPVDFNPASVKAIVVLGDSNDPADPAYRSRTQVSSDRDGFTNVLASRLFFAARVYRGELEQGRNPLVIVSLGSQLGLNASEEARAIAIQTVQGILTSAGVQGDRIVIDTEGTDLYSNAVAIERILTPLGYQKETDSLLLVVPLLNVSRARATFASRGLRTLGLPTDQFLFQLDDRRLIASVADLVPNVDALALTTRVVDEYLSSVYYFMRGWLVSPI
ncbi:hypothetical protein O77CONTIG1_01375 [Leptolyngbya sp. O-77]|nr:hypothetical protein O77CONTIG1_01375 [Leptolyngbya sp. O-77]